MRQKPIRRASELHEARPELAKLKGEDGARYGADGVHDAKGLRPPLCQGIPNGIAPPHPESFGQQHHQGKADAKGRTNTVFGATEGRPGT